MVNTDRKNIYLNEYFIFNGVMKIFDSHFHLLEMKKKDMEISQFLEQWQKDSGGYLIDIGVDEHHLQERLSYSKSRNFLFHTVGIHPNSAGGELNERVSKIKDSITDRVVGVGETGLDYYWDTVDKEVQKKFFKAHIQLAIDFKLPLIVHNRDADSDIYSILKEYRGKVSGIIHCFSSNNEYLSKFLDLGFYISYAGNVTFKKNTQLQDTLKNVPLNRLLIETDSPYLSPTPMRGRLNTPFNLQYTLQFISKTLIIEPDILNKQITENYLSIFNLVGKND